MHHLRMDGVRFKIELAHHFRVTYRLTLCHNFPAPIAHAFTLPPLAGVKPQKIGDLHNW